MSVQFRKDVTMTIQMSDLAVDHHRAGLYLQRAVRPARHRHRPAHRRVRTASGAKGQAAPSYSEGGEAMIDDQLDLFLAKEAGREGMERALDHADRVNSDWSSRAMECLREYARSHAYFMVEEVRLLAHSSGLPKPPDPRAWGAVVTKAAKAGIITSDSLERSSCRTGHGPSCHAVAFEHLQARCGDLAMTQLEVALDALHRIATGEEPRPLGEAWARGCHSEGRRNVRSRCLAVGRLQRLHRAVRARHHRSDHWRKASARCER